MIGLSLTGHWTLTTQSEHPKAQYHASVPSCALHASLLSKSCAAAVYRPQLPALMRRAWTHTRALKPVCAVLSLYVLSAESVC